jgi:hypothetical protein
MVVIGGPMHMKKRKYVTKLIRTRRISEAARELGRIGGRRRAEKLAPERRRAIAAKASKAAAKARTQRAKARKDTKP